MHDDGTREEMRDAVEPERALESEHEALGLAVVHAQSRIAHHVVGRDCREPAELPRYQRGHAFDQMQKRGIMPSVVENAIQTGLRSADPIVGRFRYFDAVNNVTVILEGERVVTVSPGRLR